MNRKQRRAKKIERPMPGTFGCCPKCRSANVGYDPTYSFKGYGPGICVCKNCETLWEPIDPALIWDKSDPYCSSSEPCNNCAFRPGSPEQQDTEKWRDMILSLRQGEQFYCHKGVPIEAGAEHGFAYPQKEITVELEGVPPTNVMVSDRARLRLCRGYLNALGKWWKADAMRERPALAPAKRADISDVT